MLVHEVRAFVLSAVAGLSLEHARERQLIDRAPAVPVGSYLLRPAILGMHQYNMPIFAPRCFESRELCRSHGGRAPVLARQRDELPKDRR